MLSTIAQIDSRLAFGSNRENVMVKQEDSKRRHSNAKPILFPPPQVGGKQVYVKEKKIEEKLNEEADPSFSTEVGETDVLASPDQETIDEEDVEDEDFLNETIIIEDEKPSVENWDDSSDDEESLFTHVEEDKKNIPIQKNKKSKKLRRKNKKESIIIKLPVLLSTIHLQIDVFDSFPLIVPIDDILKVDWSMQSLEVKTALPSTTVFLKGELVASIDYVSKNSGHVKSINIPISWSKSANVTWLASPNVSRTEQKEFMFQHEQGISMHYEYEQQYAEKIQCSLRKLNFVSHHELDSEIFIKGIAKVTIDLLQHQYVLLQANKK